MSVDLEAQVQAIADAMRARDKQIIAEQDRAYRAENQELIASSKKIFHLRNRVRISDHKANYYQKNRDIIILNVKEYRRNNAELIEAQKITYRAENKKAIAATKKIWHEANYISKPRPNGGTSNAAKLGADVVRSIRLLSSTGQSQRSIASRFGITQPTVSKVLSGETWAHVV